jgi:hypothetical protein
MITLGVIVILGLLFMGSWNVLDIIKSRPPNKFYGKGREGKINWFLDLFRRGILLILIFLLFLIILLTYSFQH